MSKSGYRHYTVANQDNASVDAIDILFLDWNSVLNDIGKNEYMFDDEDMETYVIECVNDSSKSAKVKAPSAHKAIILWMYIVHNKKTPTFTDLFFTAYPTVGLLCKSFCINVSRLVKIKNG